MSKVFIGILVFILGIAVGQIIDTTTLLSHIRIPYLTATPTPTPFSAPSPTPDPTADWKTYTNTVSDYTLKYPPAFNIIESNQLLGNGEISDTKWNFSTTNDIPNVRIVVYKSDSNFAKSITPGEIQAVVGGKTATKTTTEGKTFTISYLVTNSTNTYLITLEVASKQESSQYETLFNQVLSTFKFLEPSTTPPTTSYTCPPSGWVDCMPGTTPKPECSAAAMAWYQANCPDFKGGAL